MKSKISKKRPRGSVAIEKRGSHIGIRFTYQKKTYRLSFGLDTPTSQFAAQQAAAKIQHDIALSEFDPTLVKYRPSTKVEVETEPKFESVSSTTLELWEQFTEEQAALGVSPNTINLKLRSIRGNLSRFGREILTQEDAKDFIALLRSRQSPQIANANLKYCKQFGEWLVEKNYAELNFFSSIRSLKESKSRNPRRRPFTKSEVRALLKTATENPKFQHWHDFCAVLLYLGLRPSEAIALRWQHIDLESRQATITESLSRNPDGRTSGYARVRKATKTGSERIVPLVPSLVNILTVRKEKSPNCKPEDLIFKTPGEKVIDDHNFSRRTWRRLCEVAGVEYRVPYAARHTAISHLIEGGATSQQAADIAGLKTARMIIEHYGHKLNPPKMPDYEV